MGSTLTNGIYLPAEGERNCYTGLAANWSALDSLIGGYNAHIGNATIHVTAEDKAAWNGKADASALTAHTGDTTIHVTAEDKAAWNGKADASALTAHTGDTTIHVTAADKNKWDAVTNKANDADAVHKSGAETIAGIKTFSDESYFTSLNFTRNVASPNASSSSILPIINTITYTSADNPVTARLNFRVTAAGEISLYPHVNNQCSLGLLNRRFKDFYTYLVNNINPGALSLPDINNRVDISGYITDLTGANNQYTPAVNGWICIRSGNATKIFIGDAGTSIGTSTTAPTAQYLTLLYPCVAGRAVNISVTCTSLAFAVFIPSAGNV